MPENAAKERGVEASGGVERMPVRRLKLAGYAALGLIAAMVCIGQISLNAALETQEAYSTLERLAMNQRTAADRIALTAAEYEIGRDAASADRLAAALAVLQASYRALRNSETIDTGVELYKTEEFVPEWVDAFYAQEPHALDRRIQWLLRDGRTLEDVPWDQPGSVARIAAARAPIDAEVEELETSLGALVVALGRESTASMEILEVLQGIVHAVILVTLAVLAWFLFRPLIGRVEVYAKRLYDLAMTDTLTGVMNRRAFMATAESEVARANRHGHPLTVAMLDIDKFKSINDTHGHGIGDEAIRHLVDQVTAVLRPEDSIGRLGGEEFAVLLPYSDPENAAKVAERIRAQVAGTPLDASTGQTIGFTVSIGLSAVAADSTSIEPALNNADEALYTSKTSGRNRVTAFAA